MIFSLVILAERNCGYRAFRPEVTPLFKGKIAEKNTFARGAVVRNFAHEKRVLRAKEFVTGM